jgi:hypothetical protein
VFYGRTISSARPASLMPLRKDQSPPDLRLFEPSGHSKWHNSTSAELCGTIPKRKSLAPKWRTACFSISQAPGGIAFSSYVKQQYAHL